MIRSRLALALFSGGTLLLGSTLTIGCGGGERARAVDPPSVNVATQGERSQSPRDEREELKRLLTAFDGETHAARKAELASQIDKTAHQRNATATRLYWFTNLEDAKAEAKRTHRPILSLRLLGRLDEEYSCANSRFFRTALYPNAIVRDAMEKDFVLHWSTERAAPLMTIDFGDGRVVKRTVTGNSLHYVLDEQGRPVDAIPGLYDPEAFRQRLDAARDLAKLVSANEDTREETLREAHKAELRRLASTFGRTAFKGRSVRLEDLRPFIEKAKDPKLAGNDSNAVNAPAATLAMPVAATKAVVEFPLVRARVETEEGHALFLTNFFTQKGERTGGNIVLDEHALFAMRAKSPHDWQSTGAPALVDDAQFGAMIAAFKRSMASDTARNELSLHAEIHRWFAGDEKISFASLNERVYRELFKTPASDPWLGLMPPFAYTGIEDDGFVSSR